MPSDAYAINIPGIKAMMAKTNIILLMINPLLAETFGDTEIDLIVERYL